MAVYNGGPAFPRPFGTDYAPEMCNTNIDAEGMSMRDWFAGQFAAAELASAGANNDAAVALMEAAEKAGMTIEQRIAHNAYRLADAMLAEGDK